MDKKKKITQGRIIQKENFLLFYGKSKIYLNREREKEKKKRHLKYYSAQAKIAKIGPIGQPISHKSGQQRNTVLYAI